MVARPRLSLSPSPFPLPLPPLLLRRLEQRGILALAGGAGSVRMLAPLILDRREADGIV